MPTTWIFRLKTSSSAYLTTLHRDYVSKEIACNSQISDQQQQQHFFMNFIVERGAEEVGEELNVALKLRRGKGLRPILF